MKGKILLNRPFSAVAYLLFSISAQAALPGSGTFNTVACSEFADSSGRYPAGHFFKCIESIQKTNSVWGMVSGEPEKPVREFLKEKPVTYFVFHSEVYYQNYFIGAGFPAFDAPSGAHGFSTFGPNPYVVVFEAFDGGAGISIPFSSLSMANTAAHETGHQLDGLWGPELFGASSVSGSARFKELLQHDIFLLNTMRQGQMWVKRPACGSNGALVNLHDPAQGGQTVCDGNQLRSGYSGRNWDIVQAVLPYYFTQQESPGRWSELFAEAYADISANVVSATSSDNLSAGSADAILSAEFVCLRALMSSLRLRAQEPPAYSNLCTMALSEPSISAKITQGTTEATRNLSIEITMQTDSEKFVDWWLAADTPVGWFYFDLASAHWISIDQAFETIKPAHQGALISFFDLEVLKLPVDNLPVGIFVFYFGVDDKMNGLLDLDELIFDHVSVEISTP